MRDYEINDSFWLGVRYGFTHAIPVLRDEIIGATRAIRARTVNALRRNRRASLSVAAA